MPARLGSPSPRSPSSHKRPRRPSAEPPDSPARASGAGRTGGMGGAEISDALEARRRKNREKQRNHRERKVNQLANLSVTVGEMQHRLETARGHAAGLCRWIARLETALRAAGAHAEVDTLREWAEGQRASGAMVGAVRTTGAGDEDSAQAGDDGGALPWPDALGDARELTAATLAGRTTSDVEDGPADTAAWPAESGSASASPYVRASGGSAAPAAAAGRDPARRGSSTPASVAMSSASPSAAAPASAPSASPGAGWGGASVSGGAVIQRSPSRVSIEELLSPSPAKRELAASAGAAAAPALDAWAWSHPAFAAGAPNAISPGTSYGSYGVYGVGNSFPFELPRHGARLSLDAVDARAGPVATALGGLVDAAARRESDLSAVDAQLASVPRGLGLPADIGELASAASALNFELSYQQLYHVMAPERAVQVLRLALHDARMAYVWAARHVLMLRAHASRAPAEFAAWMAAPTLPPVGAAVEQHVLLLGLVNLPSPAAQEHWARVQIESLTGDLTSLLFRYQSSRVADPRVCLFPIWVLRAAIVKLLSKRRSEELRAAGVASVLDDAAAAVAAEDAGAGAGASASTVGDTAAFDISRFFASTFAHARIFGSPLDPDAWELPTAYWDEWQRCFPGGREYCHSIAAHRRRDGHEGSTVAEMLMGVEAPGARRDDAVGKPCGWRMPELKPQPQPQPQPQTAGQGDGAGGGEATAGAGESVAGRQAPHARTRRLVGGDDGMPP